MSSNNQNSQPYVGDEEQHARREWDYVFEGLLNLRLPSSRARERDSDSDSSTQPQVGMRLEGPVTPARPEPEQEEGSYSTSPSTSTDSEATVVPGRRGVPLQASGQHTANETAHPGADMPSRARAAPANAPEAEDDNGGNGEDDNDDDKMEEKESAVRRPSSSSSETPAGAAGGKGKGKSKAVHVREHSDPFVEKSLKSPSAASAAPALPIATTPPPAQQSAFSWASPPATTTTTTTTRTRPFPPYQTYQPYQPAFHPPPPPTPCPGRRNPPFGHHPPAPVSFSSVFTSLPRASSQHIPLQPGSSFTHKYTHTLEAPARLDEHTAMREAWIRTEAKKIADLKLAKDAAEQRFAQTSAQADYEAWQRAAEAFMNATNTEKRMEERRNLLLPTGMRALRTNVPEDATAAVAGGSGAGFASGSGGVGGSSPGGVGGPSSGSDEEGGRLLGARMALMERVCAEVKKRDKKQRRD